MTFLFQPNTIRVILKHILSLPRFIMGVNGNLNFEAQISPSIHHKNPSLHFRRPLLTHWSCLGYFMMDGCTFWRFKNSIQYITKLGGARILFNNSDCVWLKEESHIHMA